MVSASSSSQSIPADFPYRQKYHKIRNRDTAIYHIEDSSNNTPGGSANTTTPRSNKRKGKHVENDMDDDEELAKTPTKKKAKTEKSKRAKKESSEYAESEGTTAKSNGCEENDFEVKSEDSET